MFLFGCTVAGVVGGIVCVGCRHVVVWVGLSVVGVDGFWLQGLGFGCFDFAFDFALFSICAALYCSLWRSPFCLG